MKSISTQVNFAIQNPQRFSNNIASKSVLTKPDSTSLKALTKDIVFIDSRVDDYQTLAAGVKLGTKVFILDAMRDGIEQITRILADYSLVDSLQIVAHGSESKVELGSVELNISNLEIYSKQLQQWGNALANRGDILLVSCNVATGNLGVAFVRKLSELTGAEVAASESLVGSVALGGNWDFDFATGEVQSSLAFEKEALEAYTFVLAILVEEKFQDATVTGPWIYGNGGSGNNPYLTASPVGSSGVIPRTTGGTVDAPGSGALNLTSVAGNQSAFVIYNNPIPSNSGIRVTFDFFSYGGANVGGYPGGGDGISFFLIDGSANPTAAGAYAGSLGYAQNKNPDPITNLPTPGIVGGYLGVGFDEFGNFSNPNSGERNGGFGATNDPIPNSIAVRGRGEKDLADKYLEGYNYLTGTGSLSPGLAVPATGTVRADAKRTAEITLTTGNLLSVNVDLNGDGDFLDTGEAAIVNYDVTAANGAAPSTFKFGFASSTGGATNIHEIKNLKVETLTEPTEQADIETVKTGPAFVLPNGTITYKITATNNGPNTATNVVIQDPLPAELTFSSATDGGTFNATTKVVTWPSIASLASGQSVTYDLIATAPAAGGPFLNKVFSTATTFDPTSANNNGTAANAQVTTTISSAVADVVTTKTGATAGTAGANVTYTITTTNNGPSTADGVVITDTLPTGLTGVVPSDGGSYNSATGIITWPSISLANAANTTRTVTLPLPASGTLSNTAKSTSTTSDPTSSNNDGTATDATVATTITPSADVVTTKTGVT
ncbi:DUF4347 domain-containing protein, partial [Kamptonema sp. PCC 6506]|uniref:DUF4347 domain-containing protein n=1 Tax=Kamptonema sp. PCC 6506 TaxID=272129 RepID=UPI0012F525C6